MNAKMEEQADEITLSDAEREAIRLANRKKELERIASAPTSTHAEQL